MDFATSFLCFAQFQFHQKVAGVGVGGGWGVSVGETLLNTLRCNLTGRVNLIRENNRNNLTSKIH